MCSDFDFAGQTLKLLKVLDLTLAKGITELMLEEIVAKSPNLEVLKLGGILPQTNSTERRISSSLCDLKGLKSTMLPRRWLSNMP